MSHRNDRPGSKRRNQRTRHQRRAAHRYPPAFWRERGMYAVRLDVRRLADIESQLADAYARWIHERLLAKEQRREEATA